MRKKLISFLLILTFIAVSQAATTLHWQGGGGNWSDLNWTRDGVPDSNGLDQGLDNSIDFIDTNFTFEANMTTLYKTDANDTSGLMKLTTGTWIQADGNLVIDETGAWAVAIRTSANDQAADSMDINLSGDASWDLINPGTNSKYTMHLDDGTNLTMSGNASVILRNSNVNQSNGLALQNDCNFTMSGNASLESPSIRFNHGGARTAFFTISTGTITLSHVNALRSAWLPEPNTPGGRINFLTSGGVGGAKMIHTDITGTSGQRMAGKMATGFFAIDGEVVEHQYQIVNGYSFFIETDEVNGIDTVTLESGSSEGFLYVSNQPVGLSVTVQDINDHNLVCDFNSSLAPVDVNWFKDGVYFADGTYDYNAAAEKGTATLAIEDINTVDEGVYYCHIRTAAQEVNSSNVAIIVERLIAHWKFENNLDDSESTWDGVYYDSVAETTGTATYVPGGIDGNAISINADPCYVLIPDSNEAFNFYPYGFTLSTWAKTTQEAFGCLVAKADRSVSPNIGIFLSHTEDEAIMTYRPMGNIREDNQDINDGEWHMITGTYDRNSGTLRLYVDGKFVASNNLGTDDQTTVTDLVMGSEDPQGTTANYEGLLDDVRIYNYPLSDDDIILLYYNATGQGVCNKPYDDQFDINDDCVINFLDFADFAGKWTDCGLYPGGC